MSKTITVTDLQTQAPTLLPALADELTITHNNQPIAHIRPAAAPPSTKPRTPGFCHGKVWMADDFDADLPNTFSMGAE